MNKLRCGFLFLVLYLGLAWPTLAQPGADEISQQLEDLREMIADLGLRYEVADNWVLRLPEDERRALAGALPPSNPGSLPRWPRTLPIGVPEAHDWRNTPTGDYISGVRNQGGCGSCWAFTAVAMQEAAMAIAVDTPDIDIDLSEQYLVSCNEFAGNCNGGFVDNALEFLRLAGTPSELCFPYTYTDGACGGTCFRTLEQVEKIGAWGVVTLDELDMVAIKAALLLSGPVGTSFEIHESFDAYDSGVYSAYGSPGTGIWHAGTIVGYDDLQQCWIVKNSWSDLWGEDGYFRMAYDSGCFFGEFSVACTYVEDWQRTVWWEPTDPQPGDTVTIFYRPDGRPLAEAVPIEIHRGFNGWQNVADLPMAFDYGLGAWRCDVETAAGDFSLDFVFKDTLEHWDNNGGANWVLDLGPEAFDFVMDGLLDEQATVLATAGDDTLWSALHGDLIYLATGGTTGSPDDRFLMLSSSDSSPGAAPWAKAGNVLRWDFFLAAEQSNGWCGWFDAAETVQPSAAFQQANGQVLEGRLRLGDAYGRAIPQEIWVAALSYGTFDGGLLNGQVPAGNGDGDATADEYLHDDLVPVMMTDFILLSSSPGVVDLTWQTTGALPTGAFRVRGNDTHTSWPVTVTSTATGRYEARDVADQLASGGTFSYDLEADAEGYGWSLIRSETVTVAPRTHLVGPRLALPFPNPGPADIALGFSLPVTAVAWVGIYDLRGRRVRRLTAESYDAGEHVLYWDGRDERGRLCAAGGYLVRLQSGDRIQERKFLLTR